MGDCIQLQGQVKNVLEHPQPSGQRTFSEPVLTPCPVLWLSRCQSSFDWTLPGAAAGLGAVAASLARRGV